MIGHDSVSTTLASPSEGERADDDEPAAIDAARRLGARWLVGGGYQRVGDRMRITARIVDVETAEVTHSAIVDGSVDNLFALQDRLVAQIRDGLAPGGRVAAVGTSPIPTGEPSNSSGAPAPPAPVGAASPSRGAGFAAAPSGIVIDGPAPPAAPETVARDAAGRATVRAVRLMEPIRTDGTLDEGIYEAVTAVSDFIQQLPDEGAPETERTEAWVFYDDRSVYVSARLWDSAPESQWVANEMQRNSRQLVQNEWFSAAFDTYYDRRNGVSFLVNPIGGIFDYEITDEGRPNSDWNPIWDVRTGRFDGGWTVEMEIPFKSLRFRPGASQVWGLQLGRRVRWKNESTYLTPVSISAGPGMFRLSAAGTLTGIEVPSATGRSRSSRTRSARSRPTSTRFRASRTRVTATSASTSSTA